MVFRCLIFNINQSEMCIRDRAKAQKGERVNGQVPYGYIADPNDRNHLLPDPETAHIVKQIFAMYVRGDRICEIQNWLREQDVYKRQGQDAAHYVDSFGYKEVPEFLQEQTQQPEKINPLKHVEDTIEQNDNNFDGIINNTPTVDELEAKVKAGEQISLVDLAEAIKADKERGKEKPSIRAQLKADKERTGKKKNAKQKSQDLERS